MKKSQFSQNRNINIFTIISTTPPLQNGGECSCVHNTGGSNCQQCLPLFNNQPWSMSVNNVSYVCEGCWGGGVEEGGERLREIEIDEMGK